MSQKAGREQHFRAPDGSPAEGVRTVLIGRNALLRAGIGHMLSGTRFALSGEVPGSTVNLPASADGQPALLLVHEGRLSEEHVGSCRG